MSSAREEVFIDIRQDESASDAARRVAIDALYHARDEGKNMHEAGQAVADAVLRIVASASRIDVRHRHIVIPTHWDSAGKEWSYRCSCGDWARGPERDAISELESRHLMDVRHAL